MANPFYIEPYKPDFGAKLQGLGSVLKENRQQRLDALEKQDVMDAINSGDEKRIANLMIKYPKRAREIKDAYGFQSAETEQMVSDTYQRAISDPENAKQYLTDTMQTLQEMGASTDNMFEDLGELERNPEAGIKNLSATYAAINPKGWKAMQEAGDMSRTEIANRKLDIQQGTLDVKRDALEIRKLENEARRDEQKLMRETNELKRDELGLKIEERRNKIDQKKRDIESSTKSNIRQSESVTKSIDDFLKRKDYVNAMTGYRGRTPAVTTTGLEAESFFNNIKNNLTLENLDKMSGVLSETDIKILSNAASSLVPGMSKTAMTNEMRKIQDVLNTKTAEQQRQIIGAEPVQQIDQQPPAQQQTEGQYQEGATATNPRTGQKAIYTNGQWQPAP